MARMIKTLIAMFMLPCSTSLRKSFRAEGSEQAGVQAHKCTVLWDLEEKGVAKISYPVKSCKIHCKGTNFDRSHDVQFAARFGLEQDGLWCKCLAGDYSPLSFIGSCEPADTAKAHCFHDYKILRTDSYEAALGNTSRVVHHPELYNEKKFQYTCVEDGCMKDGNAVECSEIHLPSVFKGRSEDEQIMIIDAQRRGGGVAGDSKGAKVALPAEDIAEVEFARLRRRDSFGGAASSGNTAAVGTAEEGQEGLNDAGAGGSGIASDVDGAVVGTTEEGLEESKDNGAASIGSGEAYDVDGAAVSTAEGLPEGPTVRELKNRFGDMFHEAAIPFSVDHLFAVAGLTEDDHIVTRDEYARLLKPEC